MFCSVQTLLMKEFMFTVPRQINVVSPALDFAGPSRYETSTWCIYMWCGVSFRSLFVVVLILQVVLPPVWVKYGLDCVQRCRLAATTGAHCPLMLAPTALTQSTAHYCDRQLHRQHGELRCACPTHASSDSTDLQVMRYVLPSTPLCFSTPSMAGWDALVPTEHRNTVIPPPAPPPRLSSTVSA